MNATEARKVTVVAELGRRHGVIAGGLIKHAHARIADEAAAGEHEIKDLFSHSFRVPLNLYFFGYVKEEHFEALWRQLESEGFKLTHKPGSPTTVSWATEKQEAA